MRRKPVTNEDIDRFLDFMGVQLLPYQRELLIKMLNHEGDIYFIPRRGYGITNLKMMTYYLDATYANCEKKKE